jgi:hypothetical protein
MVTNTQFAPDPKHPNRSTFLQLKLDISEDN